MAVIPLFNTLDVFLKKIRLSTAVDEQTLALINTAITEVRLEFFASLTMGRCLEIVAYTRSDNPSTEEEIIRATAELAEILWVTAKLVEQLPVLFIADYNKARDDFNDEPLTRDAVALAKYKNSLLSRVEKMIGRIKIPAEVSGNGQAFSCGAVDEDGEDDPYLISENFIGLEM